MKKPIRIEPASSPREAFINSGVATAIAHVFLHPEGIVSEESREYAEIARAYWMLPTSLIPAQLLDQNHSLYSGHKCSECRKAAQMRLVYDGLVPDLSHAEQYLNKFLADARARNVDISCSAEVCFLSEVIWPDELTYVEES